MIKKMSGVLFALLCLSLVSCSNGMFMKYMNYEKATSDSSGSDSGGGDEDGGGDFEEDPGLADGFQISANFRYLLPNGEIAAGYQAGNAILPANINPAPSFQTDDLVKKQFYISIINGQLPEMFFRPGGWQASSGAGAAQSEYSYSGEDFSVTGQIIPVTNQKVVYYKYQGKNPKQSPLGIYNSAMFSRDDGVAETVMKRFNFFRWTGKNASGNMDTWMIAVDTYTRLAFVAFKISEKQDFMGQEVPTVFSPLEKYGNYHFYEYDPCGYVNADGYVVLENWYKETTQKKPSEQMKLMPPRTGKSPYSTYVNKDVITAGVQEGGAPVTGALTIKPVFAVTGTSDGTAKFELAAFWGSGRANEEFKPVSLAAGAVDLKAVGEKNEFPPKEFTADSVTADMILQLGGNITLVNNNSEMNLSTFDATTGYKLKYNRSTQKWENETGFSLGDGEESKIEIAVPNSKITMCFTVKWESRYSVTDKGRVVLSSVACKSSDAQLVFSGSGSKYQLDYIDADFDSAEEDKPLELELELYNLDPQRSITVYSPLSEQGFVKNILIDGKVGVKRGGSAGTAPVAVTMRLGCDPQKKQQQDVVVKLDYPADGFDMTYSPREITVTVTRSLR